MAIQDKELAIAIGKQIKAVRKKINMTQKAVGQASGTSESYMSRLEHGRHVPSVQMLNRLAKVIKCSIRSLLPPD